MQICSGKIRLHVDSTLLFEVTNIFMVVHKIFPLTDLEIYENILFLQIRNGQCAKLLTLREYFVISNTG